MTTLFDVTLDLARHARGVKRHKISATSDSGRTITSPTMQNKTGEYVDGTIWIMTGDYAGEFSTILRSNNQSLTIADPELSLSVGDVIMICPWIDFKLDDLIEAINSVLYRYPIQAIDTTLEWDADTMVYDIPDGVSDIRRVQIANANNDGTMTISHCWTEDADRKLRFHTAQGQYLGGGQIQIIYRKMHGEVYEAKDEIDPTVDLTYLRNLAFLYLWRQVIIHQHKDNPVAADLFNEAKVYESEHQKFNLPERNIMIRDFYTR